MFLRHLWQSVFAVPVLQNHTFEVYIINQRIGKRMLFNKMENYGYLKLSGLCYRCRSLIYIQFKLNLGV